MSLSSSTLVQVMGLLLCKPQECLKIVARLLERNESKRARLAPVVGYQRGKQYTAVILVAS